MTTFELYQGNRLEDLAQKLAKILAQNPQRDPFTTEIILVPDVSLAPWLHLQLARANGLSYGVDFKLPDSFISENLLQPLSPDKPTSTRDTRVWRLMRLLEDYANDERFTRPVQFIDNQPLRRYQLALQLATLFGQYVTYSPTRLERWEQNDQRDPDEAWQAELWRALAKDEPWHDARLATRFFERAEQGRLPERDALRKRGRLFAFGFSILPPLHVDLLCALAQSNVVDVHFFHFNPCEELWDQVKKKREHSRDDESALAFNNWLLGNCCTAAKPLYTSLLDRLNDSGETAFMRAEPQTMLAHLCSHIQSNSVPKEKKKLPVDDSIQFHVCHTPLREVEVLHNNLLRLFKDDPSLTPADIRVYAPQLADYAPFIRAVFDAFKPGESGFIPWLLTESASMEEDADCIAFIELFDALESRFEAGRVIALLHHPAIRERFAINDADITTLNNLLAAARLTWGLSPAHRRQEGTAPAYVGTWRFALDRLLLGAAMSEVPGDAPVELAAGAPCFPLAQAAAHRDLIGRFADFMELLETAHQRAESAHHAADWMALIDFLFDNVLADAARLSSKFISLRQQLTNLTDRLRDTRTDRLVFSHGLLRDHLARMLGVSGKIIHLTAGVINFASLPPHPLPPARVNIMLGLNNGAFPRHYAAPHFNLLVHAKDKAPGFLSSRDEDRLAFLQLLLATRDKLFLSYCGQNAEDSSAVPPALVVAELRDYIEQYFAPPLTTLHGLHPFSHRYFNDDAAANRLHSFSKNNFEIARDIRSANYAQRLRPAQPPILDNVKSDAWQSSTSATPKDFTAFFVDPAKCFYTNRLGLSLDLYAADSPDDEEPFDVEHGLEAYDVKQALLKLSMQTPPLRGEALHDFAVATGLLVRNMPDTTNLLAQTTNLFKYIHTLTQDEPAGFLPVSLAFDSGLNISGELENFYPDHNCLVLARPASKIKGVDFIRGYVSHLLLSATRPGAQTHVLTLSDSALGVAYKTFEPLQPADAWDVLNDLVYFYLKGQTRPQLFLTEFWNKKKSCVKTHDEVCAEWPLFFAHVSVDTPTYEQPEIRPNPCLHRAFGEAPPPEDSETWQDFEELADLFAEAATTFFTTARRRPKS